MKGARKMEEIKKRIETKEKKSSYERPVLVKEKKMDFPIRILEASGKQVVCKQCSSCHACR